ncbi:DUF3216 domain-containing protein [Thermococcus sp. Bubb.Bath]|uniref:DUF3216 domain-containing protein n=1 Tax=Thermococcus sp. Bubb.Bath TaxID=1638242 RepID=UPI00143AE5EC|nr:DUF3216 domain-containing protein [Thermococcus sp. Bubb.Bath]NJF24866.1 DUF3216 domain-containing protein [Thermococcus sp. Bubb.Bath]
MAVDVPEVEEVRELLEGLGEKELIKRLDSFVALNEGLESKRGKDFIRVSVLGFLEGLLVSLRKKYSGDTRIESLYEKVSARRRELDELFRKPAMQNLQ